MHGLKKSAGNRMNWQVNSQQGLCVSKENSQVICSHEEHMKIFINQFPEKLKVSRNQHGAYHCKDHSTYITNPQLFHQETSNYARIEEKKNHQPNFNPSNLTQFGTELHDSKLNIISIQRLTTIAQEFYELEGLIL